MKKHLTIIGGGFSSWIAASVFADSGYSIDIFEGKNESFGSQQITPNGWEALSNLIELRNIQKYFEPFQILINFYHFLHYKECYKMDCKQFQKYYLFQYQIIVFLLLYA